MSQYPFEARRFDDQPHGAGIGHRGADIAQESHRIGDVLDDVPANHERRAFAHQARGLGSEIRFEISLAVRPAVGPAVGGIEPEGGVGSAVEATQEAGEESALAAAYLDDGGVGKAVSPNPGDDIVDVSAKARRSGLVVLVVRRIIDQRRVEGAVEGKPAARAHGQVQGAPPRAARGVGVIEDPVEEERHRGAFDEGLKLGAAAHEALACHGAMFTRAPGADQPGNDWLGDSRQGRGVPLRRAGLRETIRWRGASTGLGPISI